MPSHPTEQEIITILKRLKRRFSNPGAMEIGTPYQNLVGVLLSARTRDEQVLALLPDFFDAFPDPASLARAREEQIQKKINTIGMFRQKAKHLKAMAQDVVERFNGNIPSTMEDLVSLAGVGRKTASVVLVASFDAPAIAVDTHVHRVTNRLGWVQTNTPAKTEHALLSLVPKQWQPTVNRVFVKLGRYVCIRNPRCWACPVRELCTYKDKQQTPPPDANKILQDIDAREDRLEDMRKRIV